MIEVDARTPESVNAALGRALELLAAARPEDFEDAVAINRGSHGLVLLLSRDRTRVRLTIFSDSSEHLARSNEPDGLIDVWDGQQYEQFPRSALVTLAQARDAVEEFIRSGERTPRLEWEALVEAPAKEAPEAIAALVKAARPRPKPPEFVELGSPIECPHCHVPSSKFRKIKRRLVCLSCNRSFAH
jgi:hypothetical protein